MPHQTSVPVVLMRHAQSVSNQEQRFTGWDDPPLTKQGLIEARQAGECLRERGLEFDLAYSSRLQRAVHTLDIVLQNLGQVSLRRQQDWQLNERHFGVVQGMAKARVLADYGEQRVSQWRREADAKPPALLRSDAAHPANNPLYADVEAQQLPATESLIDTRRRISGYWHEQLVPVIQQGRRVLICSHANTLRALLMSLREDCQQDMQQLEMPGAKPMVLWLDADARMLDWEFVC